MWGSLRFALVNTPLEQLHLHRHKSLWASATVIPLKLTRKEGKEVNTMHCWSWTERLNLLHSN